MGAFREIFLLELGPVGKVLEHEVLLKVPRCDALCPGYPHLAAGQVEVLDGAWRESVHHHGHAPAERELRFREGPRLLSQKLATPEVCINSRMVVGVGTEVQKGGVRKVLVPLPTRHCVLPVLVFASETRKQN